MWRCQPYEIRHYRYDQIPQFVARQTYQLSPLAVKSLLKNMGISATLDRVHSSVKRQKGLQYFAVFNRIALAFGFLPSGYVKVAGERFTSLATCHPMGHYLQAFYQTGFYYTAVGVFQMTAACLLLIPRTATLGAVIYFPIILNICLLSLAVRFEGSLITSPLMVLANLYLLCWDYDKLKFILPFQPQKLPAN